MKIFIVIEWQSGESSFSESGDWLEESAPNQMRREITTVTENEALSLRFRCVFLSEIFTFIYQLPS